MNSLAKRTLALYNNPIQHSRYAGRVTLRPYQEPPVLAITNSVRKKLGLSFVVIMSRQSGKNESQLSVYDYLLEIFQQSGGEMIHVEPTYKPQTITAMRRLKARLIANPLTRGRWGKEAGYIFTVGAAALSHFSGEPTSNVVGGTASLLLSVNEAQDVLCEKYDKDFKPMAASTNATRVFWGTRWPDSLLERELEFAQAEQAADGIQRVFIVPADVVGKYVPSYRKFVENEVRRLGREHPLVKTQYFCESIKSDVGMFPTVRIALMHGSHAARTEPEPGKLYAFLIDVAGQDESAYTGADALENPARDAVHLKIVEIDLGSLPDAHLPTYRTVFRHEWTGTRHTAIHAQLEALGRLWNPLQIVIDATGVGEGLWSMLDQSFPTFNEKGPRRVLPFKFTSESKSSLGYRFLAVIDSGRYKEYAPFDAHLMKQLKRCASSVGVGPNKPLKWGVPDTARDELGQYIHDDDLIAAALCSELDTLTWTIPTAPAAADGFDPLLLE